MPALVTVPLKDMIDDFEKKGYKKAISKSTAKESNPKKFLRYRSPNVSNSFRSRWDSTLTSMLSRHSSYDTILADEFDPNGKYYQMIETWMRMQGSAHYSKVTVYEMKEFYTKHANIIGVRELEKFVFAFATELYVIHALENCKSENDRYMHRQVLADLIRLGFLLQAYSDSKTSRLPSLTGFYLQDIIFLKKSHGVNDREIEKFLVKNYVLFTRKRLINCLARHSPIYREHMKELKTLKIPKTGVCFSCHKFLPPNEIFVCACRCIEYCSVTCQKSHWPYHKIKCKCARRLITSKPEQCERIQANTLRKRFGNSSAASGTSQPATVADPPLVTTGDSQKLPASKEPAKANCTSIATSGTSKPTSRFTPVTFERETIAAKALGSLKEKYLDSQKAHISQGLLVPKQTLPFASAKSVGDSADTVGTPKPTTTTPAVALGAASTLATSANAFCKPVAKSGPSKPTLTKPSASNERTCVATARPRTSESVTTEPPVEVGAESTAPSGGFDVGQIRNAGFSLGTGGHQNVRHTRRIVKARRPKQAPKENSAVTLTQPSSNSAAASGTSNSATTEQIPYAGFGMGHGCRTRRIVKARRHKKLFDSGQP